MTTNSFDPKAALSSLRASHDGLQKLLSDGLLPEIARAPLQRAVQGIREATGAVVLEGGVHLSEPGLGEGK